MSNAPQGVVFSLNESPSENLEKWSAEAEDLKGASEPQ